MNIIPWTNVSKIIDMNKVKVLLLLSIGVLLSLTTLTANVSDGFEYDYAAEKAFYATYSESEIKSLSLIHISEPTRPY